MAYDVNLAARIRAVLAETPGLVEKKSSAHLLEWLGLRKEAEFIENLWFKRHWGNEYGVAILQNEWVKS